MSLDLIARKINESLVSECEMAVGKIMEHPSGRKVNHKVVWQILDVVDIMDFSKLRNLQFFIKNAIKND